MKNKKDENFLEVVPVRNPEINFTTDDNGIVTLEIENKGLTNRVFQKLLKKPKITYIHMEELGSFVWQIIDGESNVLALGEKVKEKFGDKAEPLYDRLAQYIKILESYNFISLK